MLHASYEIRASEALNKLERIPYQLPNLGRFTEMMRERKVALMPVDTVGEPDIVTRHFQSFLRFLKLNNIKVLLYGVRYYTAEEIEQNYRLQDADKRLFRRREVTVPPGASGAFRGTYGYRRRADAAYRLAETTDYSDYVAYARFMISKIDLRHPCAIRMYTIFQARMIACYAEDLWLRQIGMLDAQQFRDNYIHAENFRNYGDESISFRFIDDSAVYRSDQAQRAAFSEGRDSI